MKNLLIIVLLSFSILGSGLIGWWIGQGSMSQTAEVGSPIKQIVDPRPLEKYSFENLANTPIPPAKITIKDMISKEDEYISNLFVMEFDPTLSGKENKSTTGQINIPVSDNKMPIIVMFRGYVDQTIYQTGVGTRAAADFFASNGFITVAPDFLGYAGSSEEAGNIFESRFQTYTTAITLINSLNQIPQWDGKNLFIWGHSNGGQIAITVLEILGSDIPTSLWAPVTKPFPYSILYYTDESEDLGKLIRHELAKFESSYDVDKFSLHTYLSNIYTPLQLHQGTADDAVPVAWSDSFVAKLKAEEKDIKYYQYPGADHNLKPSWDLVIARDLEFFQNHLKDI